MKVAWKSWLLLSLLALVCIGCHGEVKTGAKETPILTVDLKPGGDKTKDAAATGENAPAASEEKPGVLQRIGSFLGSKADEKIAAKGETKSADVEKPDDKTAKIEQPEDKEKEAAAPTVAKSDDPPDAQKGKTGDVTKRFKIHQTMTSLPLFGHTEVALGDSSFEGANELQIQKF